MYTIMNRVLILSADLSLLNKLAPVMRQADFEVVCAATITDGLRQLDEAKVNLVILDEFLPIDSWHLCQRIGRMFNASIILLGSRPSEEAWDNADETGFDYYMEKPISFSELNARTKALIRRRNIVNN